MINRRTLVLSAIVLLASASFVQATPILGTYAGPAMLDGRWSESFVGGGPSEPNNVIRAGSWNGAALGTQWMLSGPVLVSDANVSDQTNGGLRVQQFFTTYTGGTLTLENGPWTGGGDGNYLVNLTDFTQSTIVTSFLGTVLNVTGIVSMQGTFPGYPGYTMNYLSSTTSIVGAGAAAPAGYPSLVVPAGQWGTNQSVNMQIVPEPATMALLGIGGIALLMRKRRKA